MYNIFFIIVRIVKKCLPYRDKIFSLASCSNKEFHLAILGDWEDVIGNVQSMWITCDGNKILYNVTSYVPLGRQVGPTWR